MNPKMTALAKPKVGGTSAHRSKSRSQRNCLTTRASTLVTILAPNISTSTKQDKVVKTLIIKITPVTSPVVIVWVGDSEVDEMVRIILEEATETLHKITIKRRVSNLRLT